MCPSSRSTTSTTDLPLCTAYNNSPNASTLRFIAVSALHEQHPTIDGANAATKRPQP